MVMFNSQTKLFYLVCQGYYLSSNYAIDMNNAMYILLDFPSILDSNLDGFYRTLIQNSGANIYGTGDAALLNIYQESSTTNNFWNLARIIVQTSTLPIDGDIEGENTNILLITDMIPDTSILSPGDQLIYLPNGILRYYNMHSTYPLTNINIYLSYTTKDGTKYPIMLFPGEWFSVKLQFTK